MNFKCISTVKKELREFDRIDDQKDQEFVECEINNFQIIMFSIQSKNKKIKKIKIKCCDVK